MSISSLTRSCAGVKEIASIFYMERERQKAFLHADFLDTVGFRNASKVDRSLAHQPKYVSVVQLPFQGDLAAVYFRCMQGFMHQYCNCKHHCMSR